MYWRCMSNVQLADWLGWAVLAACLASSLQPFLPFHGWVTRKPVQRGNATISVTRSKRLIKPVPVASYIDLIIMLRCWWCVALLTTTRRQEECVMWSWVVAVIVKITINFYINNYRQDVFSLTTYNSGFSRHNDGEWWNRTAKQY